MSNRAHNRPGAGGQQFAYDFDEQPVIQPSPTPVNWLCAVARFPDPVKGTSLHLVAVDQYDQLGVRRVFMEPGAARALAKQIVAAAELAENRGIQVVEGAPAHIIARKVVEGPEGNGHG